MPFHRGAGQRLRAPTADGAERGALSLRLRLEDATWTVDGRTRLAIEHVELEGSGLVLLLGPSGSGKSSLLRALSGAPTSLHGGRLSGKVHTDSSSGTKVRTGIVTQDSHDSFLAHDPLTEIQLRLQILGWPTREAQTEARRRLALIGLGSRANDRLETLSAGERRRFAFHAARTHQPDVLLLDEPLNHLDAHWRDRLITDICAAAEHGLVIIATHEPGPWLDVADTVLHMDAGRLVPAPALGPEPVLARPQSPPASPPRLLVRDFVARDGLVNVPDLRLGNGLHALVGPNGTGKSTLLRHLAGLEAPRNGSASFDGRETARDAPPRRAGYAAFHIEEPSQLFFLPRLRDEIAFQPTNTGADDVDARVDRAAQRFQLDALLERHPSTLSGGEQERAALACDHAARPGLLLLDEPTDSLDTDGRRRLFDYLEEIRTTTCVLIATHDPALVDGCDTVHEIIDQRLVQRRPAPIATLQEVRPRDSS